MRLLMILAAASLLTGCAVSSVFEASPEEIAAKVYVPEGPPKLTIFTMVNNTTGSGGHTSLMVSGSQQVIYDPAGSFLHADVAERGDVLYGMSPAWVQGYKSAHARSTYHVVSQEIIVTPAQAERALQLVQSKGAVPGAFCANATSAILKEIPGFENISVTFFPINLMEQIAQRPDVKTDKYYENDEGDVRDGIEAAQS
ncbi:hypothetical protein ACOTTU_10675 [Roseobacter sp. EG26]|uniref:hypothetical protein n=1 Tax=Roseobacter sp. EG26 TaxID=3412477 RepID=UPI003CE5ACF0